MEMKVGIVGGTFDPIHIGHLVVATNVHHALALDETRVVVAGDPYQKDAPVAGPQERFLAVQAAIDDLGVAGIVADDSEIYRAGPTYSIDTIEKIDGDVFLVLGSDSARHIHTWHRVDELRELVTLALVHRPGSEAVDLPGWRTVAVDIPSIDVSSTMVRERLSAGLPVDGLVPAAAMRVLRKHGRYAGGR
jgi:nicotinate-nucleotide adenylyltransferase